MSAITKQLNYTTKPSAPRGRRFKRMLTSLGNNPSSGYSMGDEITFYIPTASNQVWDGQTAYLNFTLQATITASGGDASGTQNIAFDYQAGSIIRRLDVFGSGGSLLESVDRFGELTNLLYDCQISQNELLGLSSMIGSDASGSTAYLRQGRPLTFTGSLTNGNSTTLTCEYSIPLLSSVFQLSEKLFPSYLCSDDWKVVIQLDTQVNSFVINSLTNATVTCKILNPAIHIDYLELEPSAIDAMTSTFGGNIVLHGSSYRNFETILASGTSGTWNTILPCKAMSVKALFTIFRALGVTGVQAGYTKSARTNPLTGALSTFNYQVGGERVPQRPLTTNVANGITEYASELTKAFHAWGELEMNGQLPYGCYVSSATVAVGDLPSTRGFAVGVNFTQVRGADDVVLSGTDFSKVTSYIEASLTTATPAQQTVNTWAYHDLLIIIDSNGSVTSKY